MVGFEVVIFGNSAYFKFVRDRQNGFVLFEDYNSNRKFVRFSEIVSSKIKFKPNLWSFKVSDSRGTTSATLRIFPEKRVWTFTYEFESDVVSIPDRFESTGHYYDYKAEKYRS